MTFIKERKLRKTLEKAEPKVDVRRLPTGWFIVHDMEAHDKQLPINPKMVGDLRKYNDRTIMNVGGHFIHAREDVNTILDLISGRHIGPVASI